MNEIETRIQQLVDGELSHSGRIQLIKQLDALPGMWRRLGVAVIENQVIGESLGSSAVQLCAPNEPVPIISPQEKSEDSFHHRSPWTWVAAISASLLLGVWIGNWNVKNGNTIAVNSPGHQALVTSASGDHAEFADAIARSTTPIPVHFRRELLQAGFQVNELNRMTTVKSPVGGSVDIPIRQVEVKYLGNSIYQ